MGIFSVHRNLVSNCKSQLKHLSSSSSNLWFIRRVSSSSHAPTGNLKLANNNKKHKFLIEHYRNESAGTDDSWYRLTHSPPYKYSVLSADQKSWKHCQNHCNYPFSGNCNYILAGSCNELMLFYLYKGGPFSGQGEYSLWNPTIDKFKTLPPRGPCFKNIHGFGFDSESEDYKLIRFPLFPYCDEDIDNEVKLYSLKTNSWKEIPYPCCGEPLQKPSVHVNGVYYWETIISNTYSVIVSFDFATEMFSYAPYIPLPPEFDGSFVDDFVLVEYDGSLAALVHSKLSKSTSKEEEEPFSFEVWGWNGESWLERKPRTTIDVPGGGVIKVVGLFRNNKLFLQNGVGELLLFDLAESKLENLGIRADPQMVNVFPLNGVHGK